MAKNTVLRWLLAFSSFVVFFMPVLLADELTLLENWLLIFSCWFMVIAVSAYSAIRHDYLINSKAASKKGRT